MITTETSRHILKIFCDELYQRCDLSYAYTDIERLLQDKVPPNGFVTEYSVPYDKSFSLRFCMEDGFLNVVAKFGNKKIELGAQKNRKELFIAGKEMGRLLCEKRVALSPLPNEDFVREIRRATKGTVLNLNNKMTLVCTDDTKEQKVFRRQFEGSLSCITLGSFKESQTFVVNKDSIRDIHYLYSKAYDFQTNTVDIRITIESGMGQYICTDIEEKMRPHSTREVLVGPLTLYAAKSETEVRWYDGTGETVSRDTVGVILGWAKNVMPEIHLQEWGGPEAKYGFELRNPYKEAYNKFLLSVKAVTGEGDFEKLLDKAKECARISNGLMTITVSDLVQDENNNFIATTFAFKCDEKGDRIYRITHEHNDVSCWPEKVETISKEEFLAFCKEKYDGSCKYIVNQNEAALIQAERLGVSREDTIEKLIEAVNQKDGYNFLGITEKEYTGMREEVLALISRLDDTRKETSVLQFTQEDDFLRE